MIILQFPRYIVIIKGQCVLLRPTLLSSLGLAGLGFKTFLHPPANNVIF